MRADRARLAIAAALLPLAAPAVAEPEDISPFGAREFSVEEIAADLTYGFCPLFLAGQFPLSDNPMLAERGFSGEILHSTDARFGAVERIAATRDDGILTFGGVSGTVCGVTVTKANFDTIATRLHADMGNMGLEFAPDPADSGDRGFATLESFKAPVGDQVLHLQLLRVSTPAPAIVAQMFVMAE